MAGSVFDPLAESYDAARPSYPGGVYEALEGAAGPLAGQVAVDCGAGTGIATRQLAAARGARTISLDIGERMLRREPAARTRAASSPTATRCRCGPAART